MFDKEREIARKAMNGNCVACDVCDGKACLKKMPGPGGKGSGEVVINNYNDWDDYQLLMSPIGEVNHIDSSIELFNQKFSAPIIAGPIGAVSTHYGDKLNDYSYNLKIADACAITGLGYMVGDGKDEQIMLNNLKAAKNNPNQCIVTVKPWSEEVLKEKIEAIKTLNPLAVAMDVDSIGLPFLKDSGATNKSVQDLYAFKQQLTCPFIVKGINSVNQALMAIEAQADAIVISNHGGRVLDGAVSSAKVIEEIVSACKGKIKILVDGGIRDGKTIFKALALGADAVIIARPMVVSAYGDYCEQYMQYLIDDLQDVMRMCSISSIDQISKKLIKKVK